MLLPRGVLPQRHTQPRLPHQCPLDVLSYSQAPEALVLGSLHPSLKGQQSRPLLVVPQDTRARTDHTVGLLKSRLGYRKGRMWTCRSKVTSAVGVQPALACLGVKLPLPTIMQPL